MLGYIYANAYIKQQAIESPLDTKISVLLFLSHLLNKNSSIANKDFYQHVEVKKDQYIKKSK